MLDARIGEISCPTKYFPEASSINLRRSTIYGLGVVRTAIEFRLFRLGLLRTPIFDLPVDKIERPVEGVLTERTSASHA
jgi:hypothetical protein